MLNRFEDTLITHHLIYRGEKIILGVSGGADSMALLDLFVRIKDKWELELFIVHINHGLRGKEAEADANLVKEYCAKKSIPFFLEMVDVTKEAIHRKKSFEETGREVRYESFEKYRKKYNAHKIAVAHNQNDQAETMLMRFIRGSAIDGLAGMSIYTKPYIIRPLISFSRDDIEMYCQKHNITFATDATNYDVKYTRNRIRNVLIPEITTNFNPNIIKALANKSDIFRNDADFINHQFEDIYKSAPIDTYHRGFCLSLDYFNELHPSMQSRFIRKIVDVEGSGLRDVSSGIVIEVLKLVNAGRHGAKKIISGIEFEISYDKLIWNVCSHNQLLSDTFDNLNSNELVANKKNLYEGIYIEKIDADKIEGDLDDLYIRFRQAGDKFNPLGMKGEKKLKDFFIDEKVPRSKRDCIPLICDEKGIIWVVGYRISNRVRISKTTNKVLQLEFIDGDFNKMVLYGC